MNDSSDQVFSEVSISFKECRSKVKEISKLQSSKDETEAHAVRIKQVCTSLSLLTGNSPLLELLNQSALHYRRLIAELVNLVKYTHELFSVNLSINITYTHTQEKKLLH